MPVDAGDIVKLPRFTVFWLVHLINRHQVASETKEQSGNLNTRVSRATEKQVIYFLIAHLLSLLWVGLGEV